ncbi:MAG: DUF5810 domain-containing protein [Halococcoides sp.]
MYECPVCGDRQVDIAHLADHLAITASMADDDHERWLDAHASGWPDLTAEQLADRIADQVTSIDRTPDDPPSTRADDARNAFQAGFDAADDTEDG